MRHFGVSNVNPWQAELLQSWLGDDPAMRLEANQLQFGLMHAQMVSDELMTNSGAKAWSWPTIRTACCPTRDCAT